MSGLRLESYCRCYADCSIKPSNPLNPISTTPPLQISKSSAVIPDRNATGLKANFRDRGLLWQSELWKNPIVGWKSDAPKIRCRVSELESHLDWTDSVPVSEYDTAFSLLAGACVLQNERLVENHIGCQTDQGAVSIDYERACPFIERLLFFRQPVCDNRNA